MTVHMKVLLEMDVDVVVPDMDGLDFVAKDMLDKVADAIEFGLDKNGPQTAFKLSTLIKRVI